HARRALDPTHAHPPAADAVLRRRDRRRRDRGQREERERRAREAGGPGPLEIVVRRFGHDEIEMNPRRVEKPSWKTPTTVSRRRPTSKVRSIGARAKPS